MISFARSGGTIFNKCLASLPNVVMMSEVSKYGGGWGVQREKSFTTVQSQASEWYGINLKSANYIDSVRELNDYCSRNSLNLIIRDWTYIYFFPNKTVKDYVPKGEIESLRDLGELNPDAFGFVRDAIDVWISFGKPAPDDFFPEYLNYVQQLVKSDIPIYKFEDFTQQPDKFLQEFTRRHGLEYADITDSCVYYEKVNGDVQKKIKSRGEKQKSIAPLPRKKLSQSEIMLLESNADMVEANRLLGYPTSYTNKDKESHFQFFDLNLPWSKTIFISGVGRSGTTWLAELINHKKNFRIIFEPFHPRFVSRARELPPLGKYIQPEGSDYMLRSFISDLIRGKIRNEWTDRYHKRKFTVNRIIKGIRSNLLLGWVSKTFTDLPIIMIYRNPFSTVYSQMESGWWDNDLYLSDFLNQSDVVKKMPKLKKWAGGELTKFQKFFLAWLVQTVIPLDELSRESMHLVIYEDLLRSPEFELRRLFKFLGWEFSDEVMKVIDRKSIATTKDGMRRSREDLLLSKVNHFSEEEIVWANRLMDEVNLNNLLLKFKSDSN